MISDVSILPCVFGRLLSLLLLVLDVDKLTVSHTITVSVVNKF